MNQDDATRAVSALYGSWYLPLVGYATRRLNCSFTAEDLVQDVFVMLYTSLRSNERIESPKAWLFVALKHRIANHHRRLSRKEGRLVSLDFFDEVAAGQCGVDTRFGDVASHLSILSQREEEVLLLRMSSLKYKEIAAQLGVTTNTVSGLLVRAITKLRSAVCKCEQSGEELCGERKAKTTVAMKP